MINYLENKEINANKQTEKVFYFYFFQLNKVKCKEVETNHQASS